MVVDTSAVVAILFKEPDAGLYANALASAATRLMSAVTRVELAFVVEGRKGAAPRAGVRVSRPLRCRPSASFGVRHPMKGGRHRSQRRPLRFGGQARAINNLAGRADDPIAAERRRIRP